MKDYVEVNEKNCDEVHNCMCVKEINRKTYSWMWKCPKQED